MKKANWISEPTTKIVGKERQTQERQKSQKQSQQFQRVAKRDKKQYSVKTLKMETDVEKKDISKDFQTQKRIQP